MTTSLRTKLSNCKNCYKCIRHCPVKSIRFTDGQAQIIKEECVLCGECYSICPQNAKEIRNDITVAKELIGSGSDVYVSLAPSFIANYPGKNIKDVEQALMKLGFKGASETAIGATIVKKEYEKIMKNDNKKVLISSCCHTVNELIRKHHTDAIHCLAKVITPMHAHNDWLKEKYKDCKVVFIGPCISKKDEADKIKSVDAVLTFDELDQWLDEENIEILEGLDDGERGRTRMFPISGGITGSMDQEPDIHYIVIDGMEDCIDALNDIATLELDRCFIEMSACKGSCVASPVLKKNKRNPIRDLLLINHAKTKDDFKLDIGSEERLHKDFTLNSLSNIMPGSSAINEILKKMGKNNKEQELNCGSCGYDNCRDKAMAVFMGKADLSMCLPFLKEKAESFSDTVINNVPNGILILDEKLNVQQLNNSARKILNLPYTTDVLSSPVVRILDPIDYAIALSNEENVYDKRKYLAEYKKYVEETIIYDKEYHILMIMMKDVSNEEKLRNIKESQSKAAIEITDRVVEKQMRIVQEIASLLGETTAETKIALTKLKETLSDE